MQTADDIHRQGLEAFREANALFAGQDYAAAAVKYEEAVRCIPSAPEIIVNLAAAYLHLHRMAEAQQLLLAVLRHAPLPQAWLNLGLWHERQRQPAEAAECYRRALALKPNYVEALFNLGNARADDGDMEEALALARQVMALLPPGSPEAGGALSNIVYRAAHVCDWDTLDAHRLALRDAVEAGHPGIKPMTVLCVTDDPATQRRAAEAWSRKNPPRSLPVTPAASRPQQSRIRLGYLSSDFHEHATAFLVAGLLEAHDRTRFHVTLYSYGRDDGSAMRRRLLASPDAARDLSAMPDGQAAAQIAADGLDLLIDLKGHTKEGRPGILAYRPAPRQWHYLGFPGTTGLPYIDAFVGDAVTLPDGAEVHFTERLLRLPRCYQVNDDQRRRPIPETDRAAHGLPTQGFVFGCFNQSYKITREVFADWMSLLTGVPGSVLWLLAEPPATQARLRAAAEAQCVDPARLVFAPFAAHEAHLARYGCMDLFLDTFPITAHTTASEALWMGVPVLTRAGESFVSRVAASLLIHAGLPELVTQTRADYLATADALARDAARFAGLRGRLAPSGAPLPIFDTAGFTRDFEALVIRELS